MHNSVTAIVPVYNVESYLEECLNTLVNQNVPLEEIILINDGSTDRSEEICDGYCREYSNIQLISQENRGLGNARNVGLERATGDYVIFVDSDDCIAGDMIRKLKEYLNFYDVDILFYNAFMRYDIQASEKAMTHSEKLDYYKMTGKEYLYKSFPESYSSSACLAAYRINFLKGNKIIFPEGTYFEDNLFSMKTALEAKSICCIPDKFYIRRCRADSIMTGEVSDKKCIDMVSVQQSMWECLKEKRIDIDCTDFTNRFIFAGMLHAIGYLGQASDGMFGKMQIEKLVFSFFETWISSFHIEKLSFNQIAAFLTILQEIEKWDEKEQACFIAKFWDTKEQYLIIKRRYTTQLRLEAADKMKKFPFHKRGSKIGVYGIGKHTQAVLELYKKLVGEIQCDLYFIVTVKTSDEFAGCPVLSVPECKKIVDEIIISSRIYQQEMYENLVREGIDEKRMILLYQQKDIWDFLTINKLLI